MAFHNNDEALTVVGIKGWIFLGLSLFLTCAVIAWAFLGTLPFAISGKCLFFSPSGSTQPNDLKIYGFFSLFEGQSIQPGMTVRCSLDAIDMGTSGMLLGTVEEVVPYPVDASESHMQQIPSDSLKAYLLSGPIPKILVIAKPLPDPNLPSGYAWTFNRGPQFQIETGATGTMRITLENVRPISYVIPSKQTKRPHDRG